MANYQSSWDDLRTFINGGIKGSKTLSCSPWIAITSIDAKLDAELGDALKQIVEKMLPVASKKPEYFIDDATQLPDGRHLIYFSQGSGDAPRIVKGLTEILAKNYRIPIKPSIAIAKGPDDTAEDMVSRATPLADLR